MAEPASALDQRKMFQSAVPAVAEGPPVSSQHGSSGQSASTGACPQGCCTGAAADNSYLSPLADSLAPQASYKRMAAAQDHSGGRNVAQRSVRFDTSAQHSPGGASAADAEPASEESASSSSQTRDAVPLGVVEMDYSFTERGSLPVGLEASSLAAAFGPEPRPDQAPARAGVSARIQVGDALVSLLEHHRKHRYAVATADPDEVVASKGCVGGVKGDEPVELDHRARSLTRSLARLSASSPLVELLAVHRHRREDLTGWKDVAPLAGEDDTDCLKSPFPAPTPLRLPHSLQTIREVQSSNGGSSSIGSISNNKGEQGVKAKPSSGGSSVCSGHSVLSARSPLPSMSGVPSAFGSRSCSASLDGAFAPDSDAPGDSSKPGRKPSQCPGCGSMGACYCKDMELASHPSLETTPEVDLGSLASAAGFLADSERTSAPRELRDAPSEHSSAIRRMLARQLPSQGSLGQPRSLPAPSQMEQMAEASTPQRLGRSRQASFNEVLASCMSSLGSEASSPGKSATAAAGDAAADTPFIPINTTSLGALGSLEFGQAIKSGSKGGRWSFDSALLPQYAHGRQGVVDRRSVDGGSVSSGLTQSYASLMADYRARLGMASSSSGSAKAPEVPTLADTFSGALKQALRSQLNSPASSRRASEDTPSAAAAQASCGRISAFAAEAAQAPAEADQHPVQQALGSQFFSSSRQQSALSQENGLLPQPQPPLRRLSSERRHSSDRVGRLPTVEEQPRSPVAAALAPHEAAAAAKSSLFKALAESSAQRGRRSMGGGPQSSLRPPVSPGRESTGDRGFPGQAAGAAETPGPGNDLSPRRLSCARARNLAAQQQQPQAQRVWFAGQDRPSAGAPEKAVAGASFRRLPGPSQEAARASVTSLPGNPVPARPTVEAAAAAARAGSRDGDARERQARQLDGRADTAIVLAAVAEHLAKQGEKAEVLVKVASPDIAPLCRSLRPLRIPSAQEQPPPPPPGDGERVTADMRELSLQHFVQHNASQDGCAGAAAGERGGAPKGGDVARLKGGQGAEPPATAAPAGPLLLAPAAAAAGRELAARALFNVNQQSRHRAIVREMDRNLEQDGSANGSRQLSNAVPVAGSKNVAPALSSLFTSKASVDAEPSKRSLTFTPSTPTVRTEPMSCSPARQPPSPTPAEAGSGCSIPFPAGNLPLVGPADYPHALSPTSMALCMPITLPPASQGHQALCSKVGSPQRGASPHELAETYGAHRVRAEALRAVALRCGSGSATRLGIGLMPPSAMWLEHRAGAHVTPVLHARGHASMDETHRPFDHFSPSTGLLPYPEFEGSAESMAKQRRDSYLARTLSNLARAKLDHAVAVAADKGNGPPQKWEMRFADDGPDATFGHGGDSKEGAIARAKRMMAEAAAAHPSHAFFTDGNIARRDADGITALLSVLATPKTALKMQERALSTLAFLATSAANAKIVVNSNGVAALVPLLCARSDGVVTAAAGVLRCLLPLPSGQEAFVEENGLAILTSLLSASKSEPVLLAALGTLTALTEASEACEDAAAGASLIARCGAVNAAVRLACPAAFGGGGCSGGGCAKPPLAAAAGAPVDPVTLAALALLLKLAGHAELRPTLRSANLMSALAAMMVPGAADALLSPAIQLTAMLASDMAAAAEFAARGGVIGLMALVSDSTDTEGFVAVQAAAVLGCLVQCSRARSAVWAAGGGSVLLPALLEACPLALSGVLYLLSCLAEFKDMRAELEAADAVPMLLDLLATVTDSQIQAATVSLLRIFTRGGETLCPILEHQTTPFSQQQLHQPPFSSHLLRSWQPERRSFDSCQRRQAERKPDMPLPLRSQSLSLF